MAGLLLLLAVAYALLVVLGTAALLLGMMRPARRTMARAIAVGCPTDPTDVGLEGSEETFTLSDGSATMGFVIRGHQPDGPVAIVLHGHSDSRFGALYRAQVLARYVSHVVLFDLPGHGDAAARLASFGIRERDDVVAVRDGLARGMVGPAGVVLYGYSMGGQIAVLTAADRPGFVGVIAEAPYRYWDEGLRRVLRRRRLPTSPFVRLAGLALHVIFRGNPKHFDRASDAARLKMPLLVIHGEADDVCPPEAGRAIAQAAPNGRFVEIPGGGHMKLIDADIELTHATLGAFFEHLRHGVRFGDCGEAAHAGVRQ